jgi:hemolysin III
MAFWKMKEPVNTITHFVPFLASIGGLVALIRMTSGNTPRMLAMVIYGASMILLYGASSLYHWAMTTPARELTLRKIDHISIYALIAGTYTPLLYVGLSGLWRWATLICVWALALTGMIMDIWFINLPRWVSTAFYLGLGWFAVVPFVRLIHTLPKGATVWMIIGGAFYSVGAVIYATKWPDFFPKKFGFHEIFHLFIVAGSVANYVMIAGFVAPI